MWDGKGDVLEPLWISPTPTPYVWYLLSPMSFAWLELPPLCTGEEYCSSWYSWECDFRSSLPFLYCIWRTILGATTDWEGSSRLISRCCAPCVFNFALKVWCLLTSFQIRDLCSFFWLFFSLLGSHTPWPLWSVLCLNLHGFF